MSANYAIYTSPTHQPIPNHLPTLIITPHGKPHQVLYTYLHTNYNQENYLLTPSDQGDLCVAKLFPSNNKRANKPSDSNSTHHSSPSDRSAVKCEASRNLRWTIRNEGIQNPVYKLTLPNPDNPQLEQPLFQVSKPNPNSPWWSLFYFTYAGHLIPPKRIEFGKIVKAPSHEHNGSRETKITVTGKTEEEKAVWRTLGEGNEDMVEWILVCAALNILDEEITKASEAAGVQLAARPSLHRPSNPTQPPPHQAPPPHQQQRQHPVSASDRQLHPTGSIHRPNGAGVIRPAVYNNNTPPSIKPAAPSFIKPGGPPSSQSNLAHAQSRKGNTFGGPTPSKHNQIQPAHPSSSRAGPAHGGSFAPGALRPGAMPPGRGPAPPHQQASAPPEIFSDGPTSLPHARNNLSLSTSSSSSSSRPTLSSNQSTSRTNLAHSQSRNSPYHSQSHQQQNNSNIQECHPHNSRWPDRNPNFITPASLIPSSVQSNPNSRPFVNNNQPSASRASIQTADYPITRPKQVR